MLTLAEFVAIVGLVVAAIGLGYMIGRGKREDDRNDKRTQE